MADIFMLQLPELSDYECSFYDATGNTAPAVPAHTFPVHMHDAYEIYVLAEGDVSFCAGQQVFKLHPHDALVVRPHEIHNCILEKTGPHRHLCFWYGNRTDFLLGDLLPSGAAAARIPLGDAAFSRAQEIAKEMTGADRDGNTEDFFCLSVEFLHILRRAHRADGQSGSGGEELPLPLRALLSDMHTNYAAIRDLDELAARHFISRSTMNRLFRTCLHTTPRQYLEARRLAAARVLLRQGMRVYEVGTQVGFSDYSNFIRLFRRRFGLTPMQYRHSPPAELSRSPYADTEEARDT